MKTRLTIGWLLAVAAITTMSWNRIVVGDDCKKSKQSNPISTPCDECYFIINPGKYFTCGVGEGVSNPIDTTCDEPTTENGVQCDEFPQDCPGPALYYDTAQECANNQNYHFELQYCSDFGITWTQAYWWDNGDLPVCDQ